MKIWTMLIAAMLLLAPTLCAEKVDKRALAKAWGPVERSLKDVKGDVEEQADLVRTLNGMLDYKHAKELLEFWISCDQAWDISQGDTNKVGRKVKGDEMRAPDAYVVASAILKAVRSMKDPGETYKFEDDIEENKDWDMQVRMAMLDAMARNADDVDDEESQECLAYIVELAKDPARDTDMRIVALAHLEELPHTEATFEVVLGALKDRSWRVRDVAIEVIRSFADMDEDKVVLALINMLSTERGKLRKSIVDALKRLTGEDKGYNSDDWSDWWANKKREEAGLPPRKGHKTAAPKRVFETETFSDRFIFLIDTSVSMLEKISPEEKERLKKSITSGKGEKDADKRRPLDWSKINCKLDLAREELIRSLEVMDPEKTQFTIISFSTTVSPWKEELVTCDEKNIEAAAKWLRGLKGQKKTNVFGALDAALDLSEELAGADVGKRKKKKRKKGEKRGPISGEPHADDSIPDTIFIYSDGFATWGKYAGRDKEWAAKGLKPDEKAKLYSGYMKLMVEELKARNRIARITINTVGVGRPQDYTTLRMVARAADGVYVPIGK